MGCSKLAIIFATILAAATFADARNTHRGGNHIRRGTFAVDTPTLLTTVHFLALKRVHPPSSDAFFPFDIVRDNRAQLVSPKDC